MVKNDVHFETAFAKNIDISTKDNKGLELNLLKDIDKEASLFWEEHCIECAPPTCYNSCPHFELREDGKCKRTLFGIEPVKSHHSSVSIKFREWGNIESHLNLTSMTDKTSKVFRFFEKVQEYAIKKHLPKAIRRLLFKVVYKCRKFYFESLKKLDSYDYFYLVVNNESHSQHDYCIEIHSKSKTLYKNVFSLSPGRQIRKIAFDEMFGLSTSENFSELRVRIYPVNALGSNIVVEYCNFVKLIRKDNGQNNIKVVAWDLDNTLWSGVLSEDGLENLKIRDYVVELLDYLDNRGIVNIALSKNNHDDAIKALEYFGIEHLFSGFGINWGQKSENLIHVIKDINLGIDSVIFVDDSAHERAEVSQILESKMIFSDKQMLDGEIYTLFADSISDQSLQRRLSYRQESTRKEYQAKFSDNYEDYIRNLQINVTLDNGFDSSVFTRSLELLQRSNQLNLSTNRYSEAELKSLITSLTHYCYAFEVSDRFGYYGFVGFISFEVKNGTMVIMDLVVSCRIAQKFIEMAVINKVCDIHSCHSISAKYIETAKNKPIFDMFIDAGFLMEDGFLTLEMDKKVSTNLMQVVLNDS